jgi:hypothetical protein
MYTLMMIVALAAAQTAAPNTLRLEEGMVRPAATIADMAWLTGTWEGEGLGGTVDEVWTAPAGGAMAGFFRLVRDGKPVFYELLTVLEHEGSLEMRLKHANPDMTGWEEKNHFVTFKLVKLDDTGAYFSGFTLKRLGPDTLEGYLALRDRAAGTSREEKFTFRRVR